MSLMNKNHLTVNGDRLKVSMPFAKVDQQSRLVSGWATLDNIDTEGDVVLAEASAKAFSRARGNIREMHQPIAVGKMVSFREEEFFHEGEFYRGIFVTAYVSRGAQDTWEKVLDGTLTGFSIGGEIKEASNEFVKDANRTVRFIKDYELTELSLVDNPANQLADVVSIEKNILSVGHDDSGAVLLKGIATETSIENVFMCDAHEDTIIISKEDDSSKCPTCDSNMENIGWFERGDNRAEQVSEVVSKFLAPKTKEAAPISGEGGVEEMSTKKSSKPAEEAVEVEAVEPETAEEDATEPSDVEEVEEEVEESDAPEEVEDEESEISKKIDELHQAVKTSLEESTEQTLAKVSELEGKVEEAKNEFLTKAAELEEKITGFGEKVEAQKMRLAALETSLEKMNRSDAIKKSVEYQQAEEIVQRDTFWGGAFSSD